MPTEQGSTSLPRTLRRWRPQSPPPGTPSGTHLDLCELVRTLAEQSDATGQEGPGTRLTGRYHTVVRALNAVLAAAPAQAAPKRTGLAAVREIRDGAATKRNSRRVN